MESRLNAEVWSNMTAKNPWKWWQEGKVLGGQQDLSEAEGRVSSLPEP